ncbi:toll-like receptor 4 [Crassostrea angulata]|uniref:toll-like receptor 4 n=1 Tax=Magallana angulata TaxID=2784310 RepID=UPI0022B0ADF8|nr:toll-like receptor 4 [Crassostrea angulata]
MVFLLHPVLWTLPMVALMLTEKETFKCSSNHNCTCYKREDSGILFADCSNLNLQSAPLFNDEVTGIILTRNNISEFPLSLPRNIRYLDISRNVIETIKETSLSNYKAIHNISLSANGLKSIELGFFLNSKSLTHLDVSNNQELTLEVLVNISHDLSLSTSIRVLNLENVQCTYGVSFIIWKYHVSDLKSTQLEQLNLASNRINSLEFGVLSTLPKSLKHLNLANNVLSYGFYIAEFGSLHSMISLNISFQSYFHQLKYSDLLNVCNDSRTQQTSVRSNYPVKDSKTTGNSQVSSTLSLYLPPNLEVFYFHDNMYKMTLEKFSFTSLGPPKITHLYFQNNIIYGLNGPILGANSVRYIDLSNNFCNFISDQFFDGMNNVSYLDLSKNALGKVLEDDYNGNIFRNLVNLTTLNLRSNRIVRLPPAIFRNLNELETIDISDNSLSEFSVPLGNVKRLKRLDLSNNQLLFLDEKTQNAIDSLSRNKKILVNITGNRLTCICEQLEFLRWMAKSKNVKFLNLDDYLCTFRNSFKANFLDIDNLLQVMEKHCASYIVTIVIMTSLIFITLTTTFGRILYRYRWKLRYMYYVAREKYRDNVENVDGMTDSSFHFDAFVSYAEKDGGFVIELVKRMEDNHNLKLCIHNRDFIPGTGIADNITNAIHNSRRTVAIMTSHFLDSYWCMFELNMARMEAIYSRNGENVLILVALEKLAMANLPFYFIDLIESRSYIEFPENRDDDEESAFRSKLVATLKSRE